MTECGARKRISSNGQAASQLIAPRGRFRSGIEVRLKWPTTKTHFVESHFGAQEIGRSTFGEFGFDPTHASRAAAISAKLTKRAVVKHATYGLAVRQH